MWPSSSYLIFLNLSFVFWKMEENNSTYSMGFWKLNDTILTCSELGAEDTVRDPQTLTVLRGWLIIMKPKEGGGVHGPPPMGSCKCVLESLCDCIFWNHRKSMKWDSGWNTLSQFGHFLNWELTKSGMRASLMRQQSRVIERLNWEPN